MASGSLSTVNPAPPDRTALLTPGERFQAEVIRWRRDAQARETLPLRVDEYNALTDETERSDAGSILQSAESFRAPYQLEKLDTPDRWDDFDARMRYAHRGQMGPWNRIVSILRGHKAKCCIVEENYVCLDYRSEIASFYSQLDASMSRKSIRLHFFANIIDDDSIFTLCPEDRSSYLGYVVCRGGTLPLVGRTVIQVPDYVTESAAIQETVYFFGQRLAVLGVPFMQQDERFANCAQVSAWTTNYSAYRRGLVERRLIADVVAQTRTFRPMRPYPSSGLMAPQIAELIRETGMRAEIWWTPASGVESHYPHTTADEVPNAQPLITRAFDLLKSLGGPGSDGHPTDVLTGAVEDLQPHREGDSIEGTDPRSLAPRDPQLSLPDFASDLVSIAIYLNHEGLAKIADALQDVLIDYFSAPYLRSKWPIYCDTTDHAMVLVGRASNAHEEPIFFFHDDQCGPYLASRFAFSASKGAFQYQAHIRDADGTFPPRRGGAPEDDRAHDVMNSKGPFEGGLPFDENQRGVRSLVIPCPNRLLLDPVGAKASAHRLVTKTIGPQGTQTRVSLLMGIDYKDERRRAVTKVLKERGAVPNESTLLELYSAMHLAEWVIVVEGVRGKSVEWEVVFDGSSGSANPLIQFARCDESAVLQPPGRNANTQIALVERIPLPPVDVPSRLGKGRRPEPDEIRVPMDVLD